MTGSFGHYSLCNPQISQKYHAATGLEQFANLANVICIAWPNK
jgi:hypothetical protein